ncbi:MAG: hypothetical protein ACPGN3_13210 [Opitutales bacterium]
MERAFSSLVSGRQRLPNRRKQAPGFALVMALALITFLILLIVSLTSIIRIESNSNETEQAGVQAQQNAMLAMRIALGELQSSLGPDQRVSAPAEVFDTSADNRSNTIGVWASSDVTSENLTKGDLIGWLASDAKDANDAIITDYNQSNAPSNGDANSATLVGPGSVNTNQFDEVVVNLDNTEILRNDQVVGRYAWWVGDEGAKARVDMNKGAYIPNSSEERKFRAVSQYGSLAQNAPEALNGLKAINFAATGSLFQDLSQIELIANNGEEVDKEYFHDITLHGHGVLSDLRKGGLKKDLSLVFEMDDFDFDRSEFALDGPDSYSPWPGASFNVQPVFMMPNSTGVDAHGPNWHVLRDYYTIYHRMQSPMTNPTFEAQIMGPSLYHPNSRYNYPDGANDDFNNQPAHLLSGGQSYSSMGTGERNSPTVNELLVSLNPYQDGPMLFAGAEFDPLRSRESGARSPIPTPVSGSYMPFFSRAVIEPGVWFQWETANTSKDRPDENGNPVPDVDGYQMYRSVRSYFILKNPYNVSIDHGDLAIEIEDTDYTLNLFSGAFPSTSLIFSNASNIGAQGDRTLKHRVVAEGDTLNPGEMVTYNGVASRTSSLVSSKIPSGTYPDWQGADNDNATHWRNRFGDIKSDGIPPNGDNLDGFVFTDPGPHTIVARAGVARSSRMVSGSNNYNTSRYQLWDLKYYFLSRENQGPVSGGTLLDDWPVVSSFASPIVGPSENYDNAESVTQEFRFPMTSQFFNNTSFPQEYRNGFQTPVDLNLHDSLQDSIAIIRFDLQLKPSEFVNADGYHFRYPVYTMTNPLAPVKESKGFLPPGEKLSEGSVGYPTFSPGWEAQVTFGGGFPNAGVSAPAGEFNNWGPSSGESGDGVSNVVVLELPTSPVVSLGKLQHANISIYDHMPAMAIGNSFASPYVALDSTYNLFNNRWGNERIFYDISYLMNEALWDSYYFSSLSIPYNPNADDYDELGSDVSDTFDLAFDTDNLDPDALIPLPNPRMSMHYLEGEDFQIVRNKLFDGDDINPEGYARAAENMKIAGAFNVNSTSVDAWQAILSGARDQAIYLSGSNSGEPLTTNSTPIARLSQPIKTEASADRYDTNSWGGFRSFTDVQIRSLATAIVDQIVARSSDQGHPFLTLGEFVNRRLSNDEYGLAGVIQAAIDASNFGEQGDMEVDTFNDVPRDSLTHATYTGSLGFPYPGNLTRSDGSSVTTVSSASAYVLQADILQAIGSFLNARSDCFRIRAYGESLGEDPSQPGQKAWCEAIVQRITYPLIPRADAGADNVEIWSGLDINGDPTPFGRKFQVISFRWLSEDEV